MRLTFRGRSRSPIVGSASGSYSETTVSYASSIDTSLTLTMRVCRNLGYSKTIPEMICHGFSQQASDFDQATMRRKADRGFTVYAPDFRGRGGGTGLQDAGAREIYDGKDALAWIRANIPGVSSRYAVACGYSGGGGNVLSFLTKFLDHFTFWVVHFGMSDYALWHAEGAAGVPGTLESWVGGTPAAVPNNYAARKTRGSVAKVLRYAGADHRLRIYHDSGDSAVAVSHSRAVRDELVAAGLSGRVVYTESTDGTYAHGLPADVAGIRTAETVWSPIAISRKPWSMPLRGSIDVNGFASAKAFEVWCGERLSPAPRNDNTNIATGGGRSRTAALDYDLETGAFTFTPQQASCYAQVILADGRTAGPTLITGPTTLMAA